MKITFAPAVPAAATLIARLVGPDALPAGLDPVLAQAAKAARFTGKSGQLFDGFVAQGGNVVRFDY